MSSIDELKKEYEEVMAQLDRETNSLWAWAKKNVRRLVIIVPGAFVLGVILGAIL